VITELKTPGEQGTVIAWVDGLKRFAQPIEVVHPKAAEQLCIVHMVRNNLNVVSCKMQREVAADLKTIYSTVEMAEQTLGASEEK
jgi:putative transposase